MRIGGLQQYLYRMIDEAGHVVDVLLREHRDTASAEAFFRQAQERTAGLPEEAAHLAGCAASAERFTSGARDHNQAQLSQCRVNVF